MAALSVPRADGNRVRGRTVRGDDLLVDLADMSIEVNGRPGHDWSDRLHAGPWLFADWDGGAIALRTGGQETTFSDRGLAGLAWPAG